MDQIDWAEPCGRESVRLTGEPKAGAAPRRPSVRVRLFSFPGQVRFHPDEILCAHPVLCLWVDLCLKGDGSVLGQNDVFSANNIEEETPVRFVFESNTALIAPGTGRYPGHLASDVGGVYSPKRLAFVVQARVPISDKLVTVPLEFRADLIELGACQRDLGVVG